MRLHKLNGLKQAPSAWYTRLSDFLLSIGFLASKIDTSLFILSDDTNIFYLMVYVDDILLTVKRILRYFKGTSSYGFHITQGSSFALHGLTLHGLQMQIGLVVLMIASLWVRNLWSDSQQVR